LKELHIRSNPYKTLVRVDVLVIEKEKRACVMSPRYEEKGLD
jgi:hypothetical protein